jgi:hypothetical protein
MSFFMLTQTFAQQPKPGIVHLAGSQPPPEVDVDELDALVLLEELAPLDDDALEALEELFPLDELAPLEELAPLDALVELDEVVVVEELEPLEPLDALEAVLDELPPAPLLVAAPPAPPPEAVVTTPLELALDVVLFAPPWPPVPEEVLEKVPPPQPRIAAAPRQRKGTCLMDRCYRDPAPQARTSVRRASTAFWSSAICWRWAAICLSCTCSAATAMLVYP